MFMRVSPGIVFTTVYFLQNLHIGQKARALDYTKSESFSSQKHSNLLGSFICYKSKLSVVNGPNTLDHQITQCQKGLSVTNTLAYLALSLVAKKVKRCRWTQQARALHCTRQERLASDKHSSLFGPFISYNGSNSPEHCIRERGLPVKNTVAYQAQS